MNSIPKVAILVITNLIPSVVIPAIFNYYQWMPRSEAILFAILIWILLTSSEALYKINEDTEAEKREPVLWNIQNEFDTRLSNIREAHRKILSDRITPDLFCSFFTERVAELEKSIVEAANEGKLRLDRSHVISFNVPLSTFNGEPKDIFRAIHLLEDNDRFFGIYAKEYFYRVYDHVKEKKIKAVKRLMLYRNEVELQDPRSSKLMRFHSVTPGYSYKVMDEDSFRSLVRDYRLEFKRDFGIYGNKYMYMAQNASTVTAVKTSRRKRLNKWWQR